MKQSIIKSCDILFRTVGGYYQVTEAKMTFHIHLHYTLNLSIVLTMFIPLILIVNIRHYSSEQSHGVKQPRPFQGGHK